MSRPGRAPPHTGGRPPGARRVAVRPDVRLLVLSSAQCPGAPPRGAGDSRRALGTLWHAWPRPCHGHVGLHPPRPACQCVTPATVATEQRSCQMPTVTVTVLSGPGSASPGDGRIAAACGRNSGSASACSLQRHGEAFPDDQYSSDWSRCPSSTRTGSSADRGIANLPVKFNSAN